MCLNPIPINLGSKNFPNYIRVPCGKCTECQEKYSKEWAFRCVQEASFHAESCFITLTYADNPVMLIRKDVQDFIKRLRKRIDPIKIKYFYCGEYGSEKLRPHYHVLIFGWKPKDLIFYEKSKSGEDIYISTFLYDTWRGLDQNAHLIESEKLAGKPHIPKYANPRAGFCSVGDITIKSAKYCAKYMQKFQELPEGFVKPFTGCSTHPGLGYLAHYVADYNTDCITVNGESIHIPRYFLKCAERDGLDLSVLKSNRVYMSQATDSKIGYEKRLKKSIDFLNRN